MTDSGPDEDAGEEDAGGGDSGPLMGMCSDDDKAAVDEFDGTADDDFGAYSDTVAGCGQGCALEDDPGTCTRECLDDEGAGEVASDACEDCFIGVVQCAVANCAAPCIADPEGDACVECRCGDNDDGVNCQQEFVDCSGLPSSTCDGI